MELFTFPKNNLPPESNKWAREIENAVNQTKRGIDSVVNRNGNNSDSSSANLAKMAGQISDLQKNNVALQGVVNQQGDVISQLQDVGRTFSQESVINANLGANAWLTGARPEFVLASKSGRINVTFGGALNNGNGYIVVSVINDDGSKTWIDRAVMQQNYARRVALSGGASFMPSSSRTMLITVDPNVPVRITTQVLADNSGCFVGGLALSVQPSL